MSDVIGIFIFFLAILFMPVILFGPIKLAVTISEKMKSTPDYLKGIAIIIGVFAFLVSRFLVHIHGFIAFWIGVACSICFLIVGYINNNRSLNKSENRANNLAENEIAEAKVKLKKVQHLGSQIANTNIKTKVAAVCSNSEKIFEDMRRDPRDIRPAKRFLDYYLDASANILQKYLDITRMGLNTSESNNKIEMIEVTLDTTVKAFEQQLVRLMENDFIDLDAEISVLESTLKMNGL